MSRWPKKRSAKTGLPPGSLVHIGDRLTEKTKITVLDYYGANIKEKEISTVHECRQFKDSSTVKWIHINGIHDVQALEGIGTIFGLHPLTLEDIFNSDQRPKMEDFCQYAYIVLKAFHSDDNQANDIHPEQISIVLGPTFVISFEKEEVVINKVIL